MIHVIKGNVERIIKDDKLDLYKAKGYKVIENIKNDEVIVKSSENVDFAKMTVPQLKELAKERNIEGYSSLNKEELLAVLKQSN